MIRNILSLSHRNSPNHEVINRDIHRLCRFWIYPNYLNQQEEEEGEEEEKEEGEEEEKEEGEGEGEGGGEEEEEEQEQEH